MIDEGERLWQRVLYYIGIRQRSRQEMAIYLKKKLKSGQSEEVIDKVLAKLEQFNLLNDEEFGRAWLEAKLKKGFGPLRVQFDLRQKGIDKKVVRELITAVSRERWRMGADEVVAKKMRLWRSLPTDHQRQRAFRLMTSRGFPLDIVKQVVDDYLQKR
ncbi:hypothetical protein A3A66_03725 [Microgenomates group bacterium RIFCSPLOWO2_01_FULL_46_13]|nr:MAG: hypothetical protein A2783_00415 [Microgenomates group bacterium RIFCSPHIGHO2_01_FULL_45_11]OGV95176.1 MAG: hypothetical protein A3A66_03725 [Microgenomates group bacterium RIFCSPLOWO2_01_FULL_46_13]